MINIGTKVRGNFGGISFGAVVLMIVQPMIDQKRLADSNYIQPKPEYTVQMPCGIILKVNDIEEIK